MDQYLIQGSAMRGIADAVRSKTCTTDGMTIDGIIDGIASIEVAAAPSITVNTSGIITAIAGTKSATHQLAFQAAKTITPSTVDQVAVSSGYYTGGNITVKGDSNLVAENIISGVSIFGINGTAKINTESENSAEDGIISKTISGTYTNNNITTIGSYAFAGCKNLISANFPTCTNISISAFYACTSLTTVSFPACISIGNSAFQNCTKLISASFPACTSVGHSAF